MSSNRNFVITNLVSPLLNPNNIQKLRETKKTFAKNKQLKHVLNKKLLKKLFKQEKQYYKDLRNMNVNFGWGQQAQYAMCEKEAGSFILKQLRAYEKKYYKSKSNTKTENALKYMKGLKQSYKKTLNKCISLAMGYCNSNNNY